jgi:hypothetical protein
MYPCRVHSADANGEGKPNDDGDEWPSQAVQKLSHVREAMGP